MKLLLTLCLSLASYLIALALRFDGDITEIAQRLFPAVPILLGLRLLAAWYWGLHKTIWRYFSLDDGIKIFKAHTSSSVALGAIAFVLPISGFPRSILIIELVIALFLNVAVRGALRVSRERSAKSPNGAAEVIILGAGDTGHMLVKYLLSQPKFGLKPVLVLDDHPRHSGGRVFGVPVLGKLSDLLFHLETRPTVRAVLVGIPSLNKERLEEIELVCRKLRVPIKHLQQFADIACISEDELTTPLSIEKALNCDTVLPDSGPVSALLRGRVVLVTGAGGSIGSELCRQISEFSPSKLIFLDSSEYNLFSISRELADFPIASELATISNFESLSLVLNKHQPEVVFHAAAYKHVPLLEDNPHAAISNNLIGTRNLLKACIECKSVKNFVMISTDKAVCPENVMGATKLLGEWLVRESQFPFATSIVRFGNVINSAGSVIPIFRDQIRAGGPLTVTHPDVERYFMSIPEAVHLILSAAALGGKGDLFLLDMGKRLKILEVAKRMLALHGRRDIPIKFIGLRKGEKLIEEISSPYELVTKTDLPRILKVEHSYTPSLNVWSWLEEIEPRLFKMSNSSITAEIMAQVQMTEPRRAAS